MVTIITLSSFTCTITITIITSLIILMTTTATKRLNDISVSRSVGATHLPNPHKPVKWICQLRQPDPVEKTEQFSFLDPLTQFHPGFQLLAGGSNLLKIREHLL